MVSQNETPLQDRSLAGAWRAVVSLVAAATGLVAMDATAELTLRAATAASTAGAGEREDRDVLVHCQTFFL